MQSIETHYARRTRMQAALKPIEVGPIIDTREQRPYRFPNLGPPIIRGLSCADYSFVGGEHICRIERKSREDYLSSVFTDRFNREMELIRAFTCHALIVEGSWSWLERGDWRIKATASQVVGKTIGFIEAGVHVVLADDRDRAQQICERLIFMCARRLWRGARELIAHVERQKAAHA
jgi:ERCC4-type nuclease